MSIVTIKELLDSGVHFGHKASRWNPKMAPYIVKKRNRIHIINLKETVKAMVEARHFLKEMAAKGKTILFVGTKRQVRAAVEKEARRCEMPFINYRWIGGYLTNREVILRNIDKYNEMILLEDTEEFAAYSKKQVARHNRQKEKIYKNMAGVMDLRAMPDVMFVIGLYDEAIAVSEAKKIGIPVVAIADTDANPEIVDCWIPANDESFRAITTILARLTDGIMEGMTEFKNSSKSAASFGPDEQSAPAEPAAEASAEAEEVKEEPAAEEKTEE